jgi:hemerythrin superfamily protein
MSDIHTTDAIEFLLGEHLRFQRAFQEFEDLLNEGDHGRIAEAFRGLRSDLSTHEEAEETIFWPAVRADVPGGEDLVRGRLEEEQTLKELLAQLDDTDVSDSEFPIRARAFMQAVLAHAEQEEQQVFPAVRKALDDNRLTQLGGALRAAKAIVPTRPHPAAPNTPPGNLVAGLVAGVVDRARDVAQAAVSRIRRP